ncbi:MAG: hypothetical protein EZS28_045800, partial [Streblomastix strix]
MQKRNREYYINDYSSNQAIIASQVPVYRLVIFGKKSDSATGLTIKSTMLNGTRIPVTPYEPITITVTSSIIEDSQYQFNSPVKTISGSSDGGSRNVLGLTTAPIVTCYPLPVVSLLSQFATSAWGCGQFLAKANRFRVMRRVSIGDSPDLARLECIGHDGRNTQVAAYLVKNALTSARIVYRYAVIAIPSNIQITAPHSPDPATLPFGNVEQSSKSCMSLIDDTDVSDD